VEEEPEEEEPESLVIGERVEKDGKIQSYLTGEWTDVAQAKRRPIAVMIPNNAPALPQYGLSRARTFCSGGYSDRSHRLGAGSYVTL